MDWQIATKTHCGNVRAVNEDAFHVEKRYPLLAVADGMGGHRAGDVASRTVITELASAALSGDIGEAVTATRDSLLRSNDKVIKYAAQNLDGQTIGSTIVAMLAQGDTGACLWAGDSRLYRYRQSELQQLTTDHSYVAELVQQGQLSLADAQNHPSSNVITRAVGAATTLKVDTEFFDISLGDTFLLCSDGLYNEASGDELHRAMQAEDIWQSAQQLLNLCLAGRASDNITFIIARPVTAHAADEDATLTYYPTQS